MLLVNQILRNRYRILRQLGHGGMGAVYEAQDNVFDTTCALKEIVIDLSKSSNPKQQEMVLLAFEREAKLLAKIKHEVVPHVRDYFTEDNRQFLVMELIEGKDLGDLMEERKTPFPLDDVLRWMEQLLDGLDYLHTQNPPIFHRDIKPQNLKLTPRGKIKLLDFGIAKGGTETKNASTIGNQTFVAATLNYSPIEQIFRVLDPVFREVLTQRFEARIQAVMQQTADSRSDLYALGATVYHLLTGVLPIDALKRTIEVWSNKPDPLVHPTTLNNRIPPEISNVLLKSMELDHAQRYVSALEMQQALQQAITKIKAREASQTQNTLEMSNQQTWQSDSERLRQIEAQRQQQTRLGSEQTFQDAATQQMSAEQLKSSIQHPISEETIQAGSIGYSPNFGQPTNETPPTPNSPFNTGGNAPFNTGGGQQQTSGNVQQTEMVNFAGVSTGGNVPPPNFPNTQGSTGGAMNSNNPLSPNPAYAQNYAVQEPKKSSKIWWVLPILLLLFLGVAGAGGGAYWWYVNNNDTTENSTPTPTATTSSTSTPSSTPSVSPTENVGKSETPKPTTEPTAEPTTKPVLTNPTPVKTPPPTVKPPKTKPPTQKKNSDCIFTGDC